MSHSKPLLWCFTARDEYPPEGRFVWATDGQQVVKGRYTPPGDVLEGAPLEEGAWTDEQGEPIAVKAWVPIEESPDVPPAIPQPFPEFSNYVCHLPCCAPPWAGTVWTKVKTGDTEPPFGEPCWTSDGKIVRKGNWIMFEPIQHDEDGWSKGEWRGMDGELITVTHWLDITEENEDDTPEPPEE